MKTILAILIAVTASPTVAQTGPWTKLPVPRWSAPGMIQEKDILRKGSVVTGWFRFVDAPGRPPAEESEDPEVKQMVASGSHLDMRASIDCTRRLFRVEASRIVSAEDKVSAVQKVHPDLMAWVPLGRRSRPAAIHQAVCAGNDRR